MTLGAGPVAPPPWLTVCAAAWLLLLGSSQGLVMPMLCVGGGGGRAAMDADALVPLLMLNPPATLFTGWLVMLCAMTPPMIAPQLAHLRDRAEPGQRQGQLGFVAAYLAVWLTLCLGLTALSVALRLGLPGAVSIAVLSLAVAVWQELPAKAQALRRCHRLPPIRSRGPGLGLDGVRLGARTAAWCAASCWPVMLACLDGRGGLALMAAVSCFVWFERYGVKAPLRVSRLVPHRTPGRGGAAVIFAQARPPL